MATTAETIQGYYNNILARTGSVAEVTYWANLVDEGGISLSQIQTDFATSSEAVTNVAPIVEMYEADLGRAPDNAGLTYWVGLEESGTSLATIGAAIAGSAESQAHNGFTTGTAPTTAFVTSLYANILGRQPESAAVVTSWVSSGLSSAQIVAAISGSAEAEAHASADVNAYLATGGGAFNGSGTVPLTPGVDNAVGTNIAGSLSSFFFDGVGPTLNTGDRVTGSGANNSLTLADGFGAGTDIIPTGITISNIQNVALQTAGNAGNGGSPFDTSPYSSVTSTTVTSSGGGTDTVQAAPTGTITVTHNATGGGVQTFGGSNTTVTTNGNTGVTVGGNGVNQLPATTGTITVNANGTGGGSGTVTVLGGGAVNVTVAASSATGNITVGNITHAVLTKADNPSGAINIVNNSLAGFGNVETLLGGTTVTVAAKGDTVNIGDATATTASNQPSSTVTVTDLLPIAFDALTGPGTTHNAVKGGAITVNGGTTVSVTTNTGGGVAVGTAGVAGTYATGTVTVTDTSSSLNGSFGIGTTTLPGTVIVGGTGVTVTEAGGGVGIGSATAADDPSGAVLVTETAASHNVISIDGGSSVTVAAQGQGVSVGSLSGTSGAQSITQASVYSGNALGSSNATSAVTDDGGTTVTIKTTGGNVVVGSGVHAPTGAVAITNTFSGAGTANASRVAVLGGAAVTITETNTTDGAITVGAVPTLNSVGTAVANLASDPTGNVTINNSVTNGTTTTYGTSATTVYTNGATAVSVTGAGATTIADANDFTPTSGTVGTSTLATVNLDGVTGAATISSSALTALTIADSLKGTTATTVTTGAATGFPGDGFSAEGAHALALTLSNDTNIGTSVTDPTATALTIGTTGTAADNITINALKATSLTFSNAAALTATVAGLAIVGTDTITATGSGALTLGNLTGVASLGSVTASAATGAVTAEINGNVTAFTGGSGNDVVTVDTGASKAINGGTGSNTVILTAAAIDYNPVATPTSAISADFSNFQTLGLAAGATGTYDVSGFSGVTISAIAAAATLVNAGAGETLTFTGTPTVGTTSWGLKTDTGADALTVTLGVDGTATTTTKGVVAGTLNDTTSMETVTLNSVGASTTLASPTTDVNTITLTDAGTQTLNVTGHANLAVTDTTGTLTTINAASDTAAVDVSLVRAGVGGITITGGAGLLTASTADTVNATAFTKGAQVDSVTTGAGGGIITVGGGGGWVPNGATGAYSAGSETVNLSASAGVTDTLKINDGAISTFNGTKGGITGFVTGASLSDQLTYTAPKTVITNVPTPVGVMSVAGAANAAGVLGTGLAAVLANLNYTASNGIITFSASGGHQLSDFTTGQLVSAAEIIVNGAGGQIAAFSTGGSTYVVTDDVGATLASALNIAGADLDSITDLVGTSGILGFGSTGAANTVVVTNLTNVSAGHTGAATATNTYNDTGFSRDSFTAGDGTASALLATGVTTYNNLAASAELDITNGGALHIGSIVTTQVGASGTNSLTVQTSTNSVIIDSLTVAGDSLVVFNPSTSNLNNTVTTLIDSTNTLKTISVAAGGNAVTTLDLAAITSTALTTIDASKALAAVTFGDGAALSQAGLTVLGGVDAVTIGNWITTPLGSLGLSGANDVVTIGSLTLPNTATDKVFASGAADKITIVGSGATTITASGAGDIISTGVGANTITANGAGDTITVGNSAATTIVAGAQIIHASGTGDTIAFASTTTPLTSGATGSAITYTGASTIDGGLPGIGIGNNSTVNFGTNISGTANVVLTGDVTGATSSGTFAFITLNNLGVGDSMTFGNATAGERTAGASFGASQVNVASATTLAGALDLAAATDAMSQQSGTTAAGLIAANTGVLDWFQFAGNTYITEAVNSTSTAATHTALGASDAVVKIGGLVDLSSSTFASGVVAYHSVAV
jgi:hypothetical protein